MRCYHQTNLVSSKCNIYLLKSLFVRIVQCICSNCMRIDCTFSVPCPTVIFLTNAFQCMRCYNQTNLIYSKCNMYLKSLFDRIVQYICSNCTMRIDCTFSVPCPTVIFPPLRAAITITPTNLETESEKNVDSKILGSGGEKRL